MSKFVPCWGLLVGTGRGLVFPSLQNHVGQNRADRQFGTKSFGFDRMGN